MSMLNPYQFQSILNSNSFDASITISGLTNDKLIYYNSGLASANVGSNLSFSSGTLNTASSISLAGLVMTGNINLATNNIINGGTITATSLDGTLTTTAQPNITSVGTLTGLSMSGDIDMKGHTLLNYSYTITGDLNMNNYKILNASTGTSSWNTTFGTDSGANLSVGIYNCFYGYRAGYSVSNGNANTFIGTDCNRYGNCAYSTAVGYQSLMNNTASYNVAIGYNSLNSNTSGQYNTSVGTQALITNTTGSNNTTIGYQTLYNNLGSNNCAFGSQALLNNTTGSNNTTVGYQALYNNLGDNNCAFGSQALITNTSGSNNVAIGPYAAYSANCSNLVAIGYNTAYNNTSNYITAIGYSASLYNTSGNYNTAVGYQASLVNSTGSYNTSVGHYTLYNNTGSRNIGIGGNAGYGISSGNRNISIGCDTLNTATTASDNIAIGDLALNVVTSGTPNVAVGSSALKVLTTGYQNVSIGYESGFKNTEGFGNSLLGFRSGYDIVSGYHNVNIGNNTSSGSSAQYQILIGYNLSSSTNNVTRIMNFTAGQGCFINSLSQSSTPYNIYFDPSTYQLTYQIPDGWISSNMETWTYSSADAPSFVFSVNADVTTKYSVGMKVRYVQSATTKYGIITAVGSYSGGATLITIYGGGGDGGTNTNATVYTLANSAISSNYYSMIKAPYGFPMNAITWTYTMTCTADYHNSSNTAWTNSNAAQQTRMPIGNWLVNVGFSPYIYKYGDDVSGQFALSTATNSVSHTDLLCHMQTVKYNWFHPCFHYRMITHINNTSKTTYYLIYRTITGSSQMEYKGSFAPTIVKFTSTYL